MFTIRILDSVRNYLVLYYSAKLNSELYKDRAVFDNFYLAVTDSLNLIFNRIKLNPYSGVELGHGVYLEIHTYLPYVFFYKIDNETVTIFTCKLREELL